jgi:hypothetical protein
MGEGQIKKRSSLHGTNVSLSVVPPSLGKRINQKTRWCCNGIKASLTHYSGTAKKLLIPCTLITAVCPFEATGLLSPQKLRDPFNTGVCAASHHRLLSVTPYQCLLFLINVFQCSIIVLIIGKASRLSRVKSKIFLHQDQTACLIAYIGA